MTTVTLNRAQNNIFINILAVPFVILRYILGILVFNWRTSLRLFLVASFFLTMGLSAYFVYQMQAEVSERYLANKYLSDLSKIFEENQKLEMSLIEANTFNNVSDLMQKLNFEKVDKISYIKVLSGQVVKK